MRFIYLYICPLFKKMPFHFPNPLGRGEKILELILSRHTYSPFLFDKKIFSFASLQILRNNILNH